MKFYTLHFLHNLFMKDKTCCHGDDGTENSLNIVCSVNITILIFCSDLLWFWASLGFPNVHWSWYYLSLCCCLFKARRNSMLKDMLKNRLLDTSWWIWIECRITRLRSKTCISLRFIFYRTATLKVPYTLSWA